MTCFCLGFVCLCVCVHFTSYRQHANLAGTLSGHGSWVLGVSFCPDNTHFVSRYSIHYVLIGHFRIPGIGLELACK